MKNYYLLFLILIIYQVQAQQVISSTTLSGNYSDNMAPGPQLGSEIINGTTSFENGGSFEHVGQFYVAGSGWYYNYGITTTDYFGYSPATVGTYHGPYLGSGIMGASSANGGTGAGRVQFANLVLNNTGPFPIANDIWINGFLKFGASAGLGGSVIKVPDGKSVVLNGRWEEYLGGEGVTGANDQNYIDGQVSYTLGFVAGGYTMKILPTGDSRSPTHPYHPIKFEHHTLGQPNFTTRYIHQNPLPIDADHLGPGISAVSPIGYWSISSGFGGQKTEWVRFTVSIPQPSGLGSNPDPTKLRLVGWNGTKWVLDNRGGAPTDYVGTDLNGATMTWFGYTLALAIGTIDEANTPLPVNLVSFTGHYLENVGAQLSWQTSLETNNDRFEIQRSADAKSFESIGRLPGKGNTNERTDYSFVDAAMPNGRNYYRLKQVDLDGSVNYSQIISISRPSEQQPAQLSVWPSPATGSLTLELSAGKAIQQTSIYDLHGRQVAAQAGSSSTTDVSGLSTGAYVVEVLTTEGQHLRSRFVKQ